MPAWVEEQITAYGVFAAVKFAGYSLAASVMSRVYAPKSPNSFLVGATRTILGMAVGFIYFSLLDSALNRGSLSPLIYYLGLFPVRLFEWWVIIFIFFDHNYSSPAKDWGTVTLASCWSFLCDFPAIFGVVVTGGIGIC